MQCPDADPVERIKACEVIVAHTQAVQLEAMIEVSALEPAVEDHGHWCDPAAAEIACALRMTPGSASFRLDLARDLTGDLPEVMAVLRAGLIDFGKAVEINRRTQEIDGAARRQLATRASEYAIKHTRGQLRAWLDRQLADLDPEVADRRRSKERRRRRVWVQPESDGMAILGAYLTAEEAAACLTAIHAKACGVDGPIDGNRADMLVSLLTGIEAGAPIPVQVIETANGPELAGYGPLSRSHAASLCENAARVVLDRTADCHGYRPSARLAAWVKARDRHCRFPGCRRAAVHCDLDHIDRYPAGPTAERNLQCLCRYHHRLKTHTDWHVRHLGHGLLQWISPTGRIYYSHTSDP